MNNEILRGLASLFWSYDRAQLDLKKDQHMIMVQTINYGDWRQWRLLGEAYGKDVVGKTLSELPPTAFRPGALFLASLVFNFEITTHAPRSAH